MNYSPEFAATEPNLNLLTRIVETGGGRMLDLQNPGLNPYEINRQKTFQPRDLWEWLLRCCILLFPLDVGIRRIQIDRAEWLKATETLRRLLFFWRGKPRSVEADESLNALLVRRGQVRAKTTGPLIEPSPELFRPVHAPNEDPVLPPAETRPAPAAKEKDKPAAPPPAIV